MASVIPCDICGEEAATVVLNMVDIAEVKGFGPDCFADFAQSFLQTVRPEVLKPEPAKRRGKSRAQAPAAVADDGAGNQETAPANAGG